MATEKSAAKPEKNLGGRPPHEPDAKTRTQVKMLAAMGVPDYDICKVVGMSPPTMRKYYMRELEVGHIEASANVAQSLYRMATSKDKPNVAAAIFWLKCRCRWREDGDDMGKKEMAEALARTAAEGTEWDKLLK